MIYFKNWIKYCFRWLTSFPVTCPSDFGISRLLCSVHSLAVCSIYKTPTGKRLSWFWRRAGLAALPPTTSSSSSTMMMPSHQKAPVQHVSNETLTTSRPLRGILVNIYSLLLNYHFQVVYEILIYKGDELHNFESTLSKHYSK